MIAIIAEKPSVGQDIARVIGATEKKDGYMAGNGYLVTWALGHLVSLAMPSAYGYGKASHEDLPMLPEPFQLVVRQIKTDRGMVTDISAAKQLKVIDEVFSKCDSIIVATDAIRISIVSLSSDTSTTTSDIPSPSSVFGSPHSRTRLSV